MTRIKDKFLRFKVSVNKKIRNFSETKTRSKRKLFLLGFTTVFSIFALTKITSVLPAMAKEVPLDMPVPGPSSALVSSKKMTSTLSGSVSLICGLAIKSVSFLVGSLCRFVIVIEILKDQVR